MTEQITITTRDRSLSIALMDPPRRTNNHEILRGFVEHTSDASAFEKGSTLVLRAPIDQDDWKEEQRTKRRDILRRSAEYANLLHPELNAQILDIEVGMGQGDIILATQWLSGTTLMRYIRAKYPSGAPLALGLRWAREITEDLAKLHENGLVHRNLTPSNILITDDERALVIGFGSIQPRESRPSQLFEGVHEKFSAPEIIRELGGSFITPKADIYSMGGILAFIFSGKDLTTSPEAPVSVDAWTALGEFPDGIRLLVAHCMQPMHKHRLTDASELLPFLTEENLPTKFTHPFGGVYLAAPWLGSGDESRIGNLSPGPLVSRNPRDVLAALEAEHQQRADQTTVPAADEAARIADVADDNTITEDAVAVSNEVSTTLQNTPAPLPENAPFFARKGIPPIAIIFGAIFLAALILVLVQLFGQA